MKTKLNLLVQVELCDGLLFCSRRWCAPTGGARVVPATTTKATTATSTGSEIKCTLRVEADRGNRQKAGQLILFTPFLWRRFEATRLAPVEPQISSLIRPRKAAGFSGESERPLCEPLGVRYNFHVQLISILLGPSEFACRGY